MKKKIEETITVERDFCNICGKEITNRGSNHTAYEERIRIIRGLGKTKDFDGHEGCINRVIRAAFTKYLAPTTPKE